MIPRDFIFVHTDTQRLEVIEKTRVIMDFPISTALLGLGEERDTDKTPRGWHKIRAKIGEGAPIYSVFVGRRQTGEIYSPELAIQYPKRDWILTRILWLSGLEVGLNRLGTVDTMRRYIYIHGCPDEIPLDKPLSHGCVRMHNEALITLFNQVPVGYEVFIGDNLRDKL